MNIWFVSDLHFGHERVADIRGFSSPEEHDEYLRGQWLDAVRSNDSVWVLGDVSGGKTEDYALQLLHTLPGHKHLIAGNHDSVSSIHRNGFKRLPKFLEVFDSVQQFGRIRVLKKDILLCHYPYWSQGDGPSRSPARYEQYRLPDLGELLVHGHTHHDHPTSGSKTGRELCISWDARRGLTSHGEVSTWVRGVLAGMSSTDG